MKTLFILLLTTSACTIIKQTRAIQPAIATDSSTIWVEIVTNKDRVNGVYRCVDDGRQPACIKAVLR
jgi:hypothetical protein